MSKRMTMFASDDDANTARTGGAAGVGIIASVFPPTSAAGGPLIEDASFGWRPTR